MRNNLVLPAEKGTVGLVTRTRKVLRLMNLTPLRYSVTSQPFAAWIIRIRMKCNSFSSVGSHSEKVQLLRSQDSDLTRKVTSQTP